MLRHAPARAIVCYLWWLPCLALTLRTEPVQATHGGESPIEVLGYSPDESKVYWLQHSGIADGEPAVIYSLRLDRRRARVQPDASWVRAVQNAHVDQREDRLAELLRRLRARLTPLRQSTAAVTATIGSVPDGLHVLGGDVCAPDETPEGCTTRRLSEGYAARRYRTGVALRSGALGGSIDLESYCRPGAALRRVFAIPGRAELLALVRHSGVPMEGCYDADAVVVLR